MAGYHSIAGIGSLLSERSARLTFPGLRNFRTARVRPWLRKFGKVGVVLIREGLADWTTGEVASCAAYPAPDHELLVTLFELDEAELAAVHERENLFRFVQVEARPLDGAPPVEATICAAFSDAEYRARCGSEEEYQRRVGRWYSGLLWRDDVLPCRPYLQHCLTAARRLGSQILDNFLDCSYLADGATTLRRYLERHPERMGHPPPGTFERYRG